MEGPWGFDGRTVARGVLHFVALPAVIERVARVFFERTHKHMSAADRAVLSQRLGRAFMALNLVQGAARAMAQPVHRDLGLWSSSPLGRYYMLGTVLFYVFDSVLLGVQRSTSYDLWIHHAMAVVSFCYYLHYRISEMGGMIVLLSEMLVPWGFMLFYFKLSKLQAHPFFKAIAFGGIGTLLFRLSLWAFLGYRVIVHEGDRCPTFLYYYSMASLSLVSCLDAYWIRLYASNFPAHRKAVAALKGAPGPSLLGNLFGGKK